VARVDSSTRFKGDAFYRQCSDGSAERLGLLQLYPRFVQPTVMLRVAYRGTVGPLTLADRLPFPPNFPLYPLGPRLHL